MRHAVSVLAAALCFLGLSSTLRAEQIDNPAYQSWARLKPGSSVTYKSTSETKMAQMPQPMKIEMTMTQTLLKVEPDAVTVEVSTRTTMNGQEMNAGSPPNSQTIPAKIEKGQESLPQGVKGEVKDVKDGKDSIEINGKKYNATTREYSVVMTSPMAITQHVKLWNSTEVPGGLLKMETSSEAPMQTATTMTLSSIQTK